MLLEVRGVGSALNALRLTLGPRSRAFGRQSMQIDVGGEIQRCAS